MTVPPIFTTFRFWKGATFLDSVVVGNPDGTPVDLTGWEASLLITREDALDTDLPLYYLTSNPANGLQIDGPNGRVSFLIDSVASDIPVDSDGEMWPFKLTITNPATLPAVDYVERLVQGYIIALP